MRPAPRFGVTAFAFEIEAELYGASATGESGEFDNGTSHDFGHARLRASRFGEAAFALGISAEFRTAREVCQARTFQISESWLAKAKSAAADEGWWGWGESNSRHAV